MSALVRERAARWIWYSGHAGYGDAFIGKVVLVLGSST